MKEVLQSKGARNVWDMMDECNGFLEAITYCLEEDESKKIGFFPYDSAAESNLVKSKIMFNFSMGKNIDISYYNFIVFISITRNHIYFTHVSASKGSNVLRSIISVSIPS